jgi:POT family proton-dependent oligopeptide transporter
MTATHPTPPTAARDTAAPSLREPWYRTLFMTDLWERFGFYGMQAILVLYAAAPVEKGGLGLPEADAAALFGAWLGLTFMLSLPGGWLADRVLGVRRALLTGGALVTVGYACIALPVTALTPLGLVLVSAGTGLYKPNHQAMLSLMIGERKRREAGVSLLYVGIQVSALLAPLVTGYLGERVDWRLGFAAAAVAMLIGLIQLAAAATRFGGVGSAAARPLSERRRVALARRTGVFVVVLAVLVTVGVISGVLIARTAIIVVGVCTLIAPVIGYNALRRHPDLGREHVIRLRSFLWVFLGWTVFWMMIAQGGSVLTLFARDSVDREVFGLIVPTSWLQSATPLFILVLAPVFAWLLARLPGDESAVPRKLAAGLSLAGGSFLLLAATALAAGGDEVPMIWLLLVYLMHACGELIVAAVGIAAAAQVLPRSFMSSMMGLLWIFAALGGGLGSQLARLSVNLPASTYFLSLGLIGTAVATLVAVRRNAIAVGLGGSIKH